MTLEIEVKAYADDLDKVEDRLKKMGAVLVENVHECDTYYNHPSRDFAQSDEALRIRVAAETVWLTYKGQRIDTKSKTREEIEVRLSSADAAHRLLMQLGFTPVGDVKKVRKIYKLDVFEICLDTVTDLGIFVEVETSGENVKELRDRALALMEALGLTRYERKSYLEMKLSR